MPLKVHDLISMKDLSVEEIDLLLETARSFKEISTRPIKKVPTLRGRTIVNLFLEPSTRTRTSFEIAAKRLSADLINISGSGSSVMKGEGLKDTAKTIEAMNVDAVVIRHWSSGAANYLANEIKPPVINAGDGFHEHPTQALLDLYTIKDELDANFSKLKIAIVGDIAHSRVARSLIFALKKFNAQILLVAPPTLLPLDIEKLGLKTFFSLDEVLEKVDIIYLLRIQKERQGENFFPTLREYSQLFGLTKERWGKIKGKVKVMHPGPMNRGVEIDAAVADGEDSLITYQVTNGLAVRMALLYLLIGGEAG